MPTYEYKCTNDGSTFDLWQEVGSPAPPCPDCGAPSKKVFSPPRVIFKGPGFYVTDARSEASAGKSNDAQPTAAKSEDSSSDSSSETKSSNDTPAAKTETKAQTPKAESKAE